MIQDKRNWDILKTLDGCLFIHDGDKDVCMMQGDENGLITEQDRENAKLIAAAPELLEALDECLALINDHYGDLKGSRFEGCRDRANKAILKATE